MDIFKEFTFEAAHLLPNFPEGHKCRRLHGHSYRVTVHVRGTVDPATGVVLDFAVIADAWQVIHESLDHRYLNDIDGLENPTAEVLAVWIWDKLVQQLPSIMTVEVRETCSAGAIWHGWEQSGSGWKLDSKGRKR